MFIKKNELTQKIVKKNHLVKCLIFQRMSDKKYDPVPSIMHQLSLIVFSSFPSFSPTKNE